MISEALENPVEERERGGEGEIKIERESKKDIEKREREVKELIFHE